MNPVALVASLLLAGPPTEPVTPEPGAIMQRALAAVGPVADVSSLRVEGEVRVPDHPERTVRFELLSIAGSPRRLLLRQRLPDGRQMEMGCQGEVGWMRRPGDDRAMPIEPVAVSATVAGLLPSRMVLSVADRFPHRQSAPAGSFEGRTCLRLDAEDRDGVKGRLWFDADSGRLAGIETEAKDAARPASRLVFEAWGAAGPLTVPTRLRMQQGDETLITEFRAISVEPIPEAAFAPPAEVREDADGP